MNPACRVTIQRSKPWRSSPCLRLMMGIHFHAPRSAKRCHSTGFKGYHPYFAAGVLNPFYNVCMVDLQESLQTSRVDATDPARFHF